MSLIISDKNFLKAFDYKISKALGQMKVFNWL